MSPAAGPGRGSPVAATQRCPVANRLSWLRVLLLLLLYTASVAAACVLQFRASDAAPRPAAALELLLLLLLFPFLRFLHLLFLSDAPVAISGS